ncbi:thioredoxin [Haploplasma axanthum]|uniref:Thioredoxin n=2 Tax=Haploplasma axanthum TaxID=29552 RepID=A0A449BG16_HAPAX|nr:thioredoxin [Haploplasma axanthum]
MSNEKQIEDIISKNKNLILIFVKGTNCGVCHAVENRINSTFQNLYPTLDIHYLEIDNSPMFRGQHLIFTIPTLLLFYENVEIHRESRIIDFHRLNKMIKRLI